MFSYFQEGGAASIPTLTAATEVVAAFTPQLEAPEPALGNVIRGRINLTSGASAGGYVMKCRRGTTIAGAQVGASITVTVAVTSSVEIPFSFLDSSPAPGLNQYCVTVTAAGANATGNDIGLEVYTPTPFGADV